MLSISLIWFIFVRLYKLCNQNVILTSVGRFTSVSSWSIFTDDDLSLISRILSLDDDELTIILYHYMIIKINRNSNIIRI